MSCAAHTDDCGTCVKCGGYNRINVTDRIEHVVCECETECSKCGFQNFWAYGYFQFIRG